jgi:hypothetical protein
MGKDGTALAQGLSLPLPCGTLVSPYCKRTRLRRWANTKAAGSTLSYACLPPTTSFPPFAFRLASTHLGWGTRRQFTRRSRDPRVSKHRQLRKPVRRSTFGRNTLRGCYATQQKDLLDWPHVPVTIEARIGLHHDAMA